MQHGPVLDAGATLALVVGVLSLRSRFGRCAPQPVVATLPAHRAGSVAGHAAATEAPPGRARRLG
jgi:hypothetical protein